MTTGDPIDGWPRTLIRRLAKLSRPYRDRAVRLAGALTGRAARANGAAFRPRRWDAYAAWRAVNADTPANFQDIAAALKTCEHPPLISVLMPIHNSHPGHLRAAVESVLAQSYPQWELCVVDDGSTSGSALALVESMASREPRIRTGRLIEAGGISAATNAAADLATGDILAFLDHDDLLAPTALAETALLYLRRPEVDLAYSDDDKVTEDGVRRDPQFKPNWSPDLLLSYMYFGHLMTVRRDLFLRLGGFRTAFDGSQDYDFCLRASEQARAIGHTPSILYHWRVSPGSTAASGDAKPGAIAAARRALEEALQRRGVAECEVAQTAWGREKSLGLFELRFSTPGPTVALLPWAATVGALREALSECGAASVALIDPTLKAGDPDWPAAVAGRLAFDGVGCVSAQVTVDGVIRRGGLAIDGDGAISTLFEGQRRDDPGYMSLNATVREVVATDAGALVTRTERLSAFLADRDAAESFSEFDYSLWLTGQGWRCLLLPTFLAAPEAGRRRRRVKAFADPYANPNLDHAERPYRIRPVHAPMRQDRPIRTAFLSHNLNHEGASITLRDVVTGLKARGVVTPTIIAPQAGALSADYAAAGIEVVIAPELAALTTAPDHEQAVARLGDILRTHAAELLVANTVRMVVGVNAATGISLPSILCQHESEPWQTYYGYLDPGLRSRAYAAFAQAYTVIHMSDATVEAWRPLFGRGNARVIRNALPDGFSSGQDRGTVRRDLALGDQELVFLVVGTVCERKRQLDAVRAFRRLPDAAKARSRLLLVGHTPEADYAEQIRAEIADGGLAAQVDLIGGVPSTKPYFSAADVYVCTSRFESSPRVLLQAMDAALPILTTSVFGIREMTVENENALYFGVGDEDRLAALMVTMTQEPERRAAMARASAAISAERPGYDAMLDQYAQAFREAVLSSLPAV